MIDLNAALADLEADGHVRLYHAQKAGFWTCSVFAADYVGSEVVHYGVAQTAEDAIRVCLAVKANKAARSRLEAALRPFQPRGWGR